MTEEQPQRKMTTKELTGAVHNIGSSLNSLAHALSNDIAQIMGVLSGMLIHMDLLQTITCPSCGTELQHPNLEGIPEPTNCPKCGSDLDLKEEE
mgnify:CR=1 FL=1|tara:strand:+ start:305 stop:586 length:282 start_codon:yes stop_codon:yes gene_type:complete